MGDDDIAYLVQLVNAAWHRIERGMFDASDFELSEEKAGALAELEKQGGRVPKDARAKKLQIAYETWLIAHDGEVCATSTSE